MTPRARELAEQLRAAGVPDADVSARWLLDDDPPAELLSERTRRRIAREPLQLILGGWPFRTVELELAAGVFVPRPETEIVTGVAIEAALAVDGDLVRVLEPCIGSGAMSAALLAEVPLAQVHASDRSPAAVALARRNLARIAAPQRFDVAQADLLDAVPPSWRGAVDVLMSNPPYLPASDVGSWEPEVADHDPEAALVGGVGGHEIVDALLELSMTWLRPGGTVVVEIDDRRGPDARAAAEAAGLVEVRIVVDLTGRDRAVAGCRP